MTNSTTTQLVTVDSDMTELMTPGVQIMMDPAEAALWGAFEETALTEQDAIDSHVDLAGVDQAGARAYGQ